MVTSTQVNECLELGISASSTLGQTASYFCPESGDFCDQLTFYAIKTADVVASNQTCSPSTDRRRFDQVILQAYALDDALDQWAQTLPYHWSFERRQDPTWSDEYAYDHQCHFYYDIQVASVWNCYRRARLILLDFLVHILQHRVSDDVEDTLLTQLMGMFLIRAREATDLSREALFRNTKHLSGP